MESGTKASQLVAIGASAGGIDALSQLVSTLPRQFPAPIVVAQHLDPSRPSRLDDILARRSPLPVRMVEHQEMLEPQCIYVVPTNRHVEIHDHRLTVHTNAGGGPKPSVDLLLTTAARAYGEGLIAVILSGSGSDGAVGAHHVKSAGGTVIIQDPETASFPGMPRSLAPTTVDIVAQLDQIGPLLVDLLRRDVPSLEPGQDVATLLSRLREDHGIDFGSYKAPTIMRRLQRRIVATQCEDLTAYLTYLDTHQEEYQRLISSFLIRVTQFFRDPELFEYLRATVLPELLSEARARGNELRLWSAGCATGEEAYSLAILTADLLGEHVDQCNVRIFATDLDANAVAFARRGIYPASALNGLPGEMIVRHFHETDGGFEIKKRVRALTVFGQHDLGQRAPFPRIDLILCRNVLIYFTAELQKRTLQLFAFSLRRDGYLALGKTETTRPVAELFVPVQPKLALYRRHGERIMVVPEHAMAGAPQAESRRVVGTISPAPMETMRAHSESERLRVAEEKVENIFRRLRIGVAVVDRQYDIHSINGVARQMLGIHGTGIGEDIVHLTRAIPSTVLRGVIDNAFRSGNRDATEAVATAPVAGAADRYLQVACYPESSDDQAKSPDVVTVLVTDVSGDTLQRRALEVARTSQQDEAARLAVMMEELEATNRELVAVNQELVTANMGLRGAHEELLLGAVEAQASTEEVETLNEELQAGNEELETLNEELQATNEELNTTNEDLNARSIELRELAASLRAERASSEAERAQLEAILVSMGDAVLVADPTGRPFLTNASYERLFGGPPSELSLDDDQGRPLPPDATPLDRAAQGEPFSMQFTMVVDGVRRSFDANGQPIGTGAEARGMVVVIRDITERSLRRLQDEFLSVASHELRTPLTVLNGYLAMLLRSFRDRPEDDRARNYARLAHGQAQRMGALINDLLDVSRLQNGRLEFRMLPINLVPLIAEVVQNAQTLTADVTIELESPTGPVVVRADAGRIEQVLLNLLTNAISYATGTETIDVRLSQADSQAMLQVQDYGPGIPASDLPNIFTRFYTTSREGHEVHQGLGLGLFICDQVVSAHGGTIDVESVEGKGTVFTVRLPLLEESGSSERVE